MKLYNLRELMEDPANKLNINNELFIEGENKDQIYWIKDQICKNLKTEEAAINAEVKHLKDHKVTK